MNKEWSKKLRQKSCEHGVWELGGVCGICWVNDADTSDPVNHPDHYKIGGIETIDYIQAKMTPEEFAGYCRGNALKYISRAGYKDATAQDVSKAIWYLTRWRDSLSHTDTPT